MYPKSQKTAASCSGMQADFCGKRLFHGSIGYNSLQGARRGHGGKKAVYIAIGTGLKVRRTI